MKQQKVLIPLDGSEFSRQIVAVVRNFFDPQDVSLVLFRAAIGSSAPESLSQEMFVGSMPLAGSYEAYNRAMEASVAAVEQERAGYRVELLDELRADADKLRQAGYTVSVEVQFGDPAQRIIDYANDNAISLVAMATHGRTGLGRLVLGSVAERVLRGVNVPVLLMRTTPAADADVSPAEHLAKSLGNGGPLRVTVVTDGSPQGRRAVEMAGDLCTLLGTQLTLLVTAGERESSAHAQKIMEESCSLVSHLQPRPRAVPLVGYVDEQMLSHLEQEDVDLLVVGACHDRGAGSGAAIGPTAQRIIQHAPTSTLMVKGRAGKVARILVCAGVDDEEVVDVGAELARVYGAAMQVLHVVPPSAASYLASEEQPVIPLRDILAQGTRLASVVRNWANRLEDQGFERSAIQVRRGAAAEVILEMASNERYDLLVVGSQSAPGHFLGSVANSVVRFAEQSVLIVRTPPH